MQLRNAIGEAISAYYNAVASNLKESGREHNVIGDDEDYDGIFLTIYDNDDINTILVDNDDINTILVDKVRWNEETECVEYHEAKFNYIECDVWKPIRLLLDDAEYIYEAIEW